jgi:hypothetical protein
VHAVYGPGTLGLPPPTIQFHGTADPALPYDAAKRTCDQSRAAGNVCVLVTAPGGGRELPPNLAVDAHRLVFELILVPRGYRAETRTPA